MLSGWGIRSGDWQVGMAIEQQLLPRVSVEVGYQRRWLVNFSATDSLNRSVQDHTQFGLNVPTDARLPDGGGYVLGGLYNVTAAAAAKGANNFVTTASTYGDQTQVANSINMKVTARPASGLSLQGGFNTSNTHSDYCDDAEPAARMDRVPERRTRSTPGATRRPGTSRGSPASGRTPSRRLTCSLRGRSGATREESWTRTGPRPIRPPSG